MTTEPILLGPTAIMETTKFLAIMVLFYFLLKYIERFLLTNRPAFDRLFRWRQSMQTDNLNLPAEKLAVTQAEAFQKARQAAINLGQRFGALTTDSVYAELSKQGVPISALGAAAGNVLRNKMFSATGHFVKSTRPSNRGRRIQVYRYVGTIGFTN